MGCGASAAKSQGGLKAAQQEVLQLQQRLKERDREFEELQRQLKANEEIEGPRSAGREVSPKAVTGPAAVSESEKARDGASKDQLTADVAASPIPEEDRKDSRPLEEGSDIQEDDAKPHSPKKTLQDLDFEVPELSPPPLFEEPFRHDSSSQQKSVPVSSCQSLEVQPRSGEAMSAVPSLLLEVKQAVEEIIAAEQAEVLPGAGVSSDSLSNGSRRPSKEITMKEQSISETLKEVTSIVQAVQQSESEEVIQPDEDARNLDEQSATALVLPGVVIHDQTEVIDFRHDLPALGEESLSDEMLSKSKSKLSVGTLSDLDEEENEDEKAMIDNEALEVTSPVKQPNSLESTATTCTPGSNKRSSTQCRQCQQEVLELYLDPTDSNRYCENCWIEYYGNSPIRGEVLALVSVEVSEIWSEDLLAAEWSQRLLPGWPPPMSHGGFIYLDDTDGNCDQWSDVKVRIRRDIVGSHAREQTNSDRPYGGELLANRYRVKHVVGEGHFTKAFLAHDTKEDKLVCLKRHRSLAIEQLADLLVLGKRLESVDPDGVLFPRLSDAFYDVQGFTVECLLEGKNCHSKAQENPDFFQDLGNLRHVAIGTLRGLERLDVAGVVHNDIKPDNLIWVEAGGSSSSSQPRVKVVDFGCARLDQREENGRNWALAEGGAGHLGKWSPEMCLRLAITHRTDVWGAAVSLCELHCGRQVWRNESDSAEIVLTQALGICNLKDGLPSTLLRRSPLDVRQLYTPAPRHWPLRRNGRHQLEALRPTRWGLDQVMGHGWQDAPKAELGQLLTAALVVDPAFRPSAGQLLKCCSFLFEETASETVTGTTEVLSQPETD